MIIPALDSNLPISHILMWHCGPGQASCTTWKNNPKGLPRRNFFDKPMGELPKLIKLPKLINVKLNTSILNLISLQTWGQDPLKQRNFQSCIFPSFPLVPWATPLHCLQHPGDTCSLCTTFTCRKHFMTPTFVSQIHQHNWCLILFSCN
jgi:hypothetical protein